ncbi:uncharacterized protein LOC123445208 [Hordeum vulgare subsp. vulgare]|uniref:DUF7866 domain-containing protein n=1 Tax=Hordeum vulgare subsp. vulgare TaxID=112509 RepID=A0A8I7BAV0_HORVV|nr:uncharacterized protein LOC123445208 [Hordeum vulgare subsp. vulgare]
MPKPLFLLLLLLPLLAAAAHSSPEVPVPDAAAAGARMVPMAPAGVGFSGVVLNETRRRLGSFQLCAPCTCCGGPRGVCVLSPCCYAINCNIPNRPFGFCSFTPRSCDCLRCNV